MQTPAEIVNEINNVVLKTGYPVPASVITTSKLADRTTLRKLVRQGVLERVTFTDHKGKVEYGYFADAFPHKLAERLQKEEEVREAFVAEEDTQTEG